jgi:hypothetical protein
VGRAWAGAGGAAGATRTSGAVRAGHARTAGTARHGVGRMRGARSRTASRTIALAGRAATTLWRPVAGRRLVRLLVRGLSLPMGAGRHGVGDGSGAGAGPISAGSATDAVGVGAEAGIGRRLATHPAKLPF